MDKAARRGTDDGLSLIELLVAVAILGIITVPMLQGFIVTHRTTMKAGQLQDAAFLAQNCMEELHALTVEEITTRYGEGEVTGGVRSILVTDMEEGSHTFDVTIDIEEGMEEVTFAAPATFDEETDLVLQGEDASGATRRRMHIEIAEAGEDVIVYSYTELDGVKGKTEEHRFENGKVLRNLFFTYRPNYASTASTYRENTLEYGDTILIENVSAYPVRINVIKLKDNNARTAQAERAYKARLSVKYKDAERLMVYTNLNENVATGEKLTHQTLFGDNVRLLPLYGASSGAGTFYDTTVTVYPEGTFAEEKEHIPVVTLSTKERTDG